MLIKIFNLIKNKFYSIYGSFILRKKVIAFGFFSVGNSKNIFIGKNVRINRNVYLLGRNRINIGNNVVISADVMILDTGLDLSEIRNDNLDRHIDSFVDIKDNVWIGARALVLPGVTIERNSVIAGGSVVTKDVPSFSVVAGNPAKVIKKLR